MDAVHPMHVWSLPPTIQPWFHLTSFSVTQFMMNWFPNYWHAAVAVEINDFNHTVVEQNKRA